MQGKRDPAAQQQTTHKTNVLRRHDTLGTLHRIFDYPARWRRSQGFGVHSPFAYSFITKVLREKEAIYYAYDDIAACCRKEKIMPIAQAHMLFRILCYFNPTQVIEIGQGNEVTRLIIERAVPKAQSLAWQPGQDVPIDENAEPFILINRIDSHELPEAATFLRTTIGNSNTVVAMTDMPSVAPLWQATCRAIQHGMSFSNGHTGIMVGRRSLPRQHFEIII